MPLNSFIEKNQEKIYEEIEQISIVKILNDEKEIVIKTEKETIDNALQLLEIYKENTAAITSRKLLRNRGHKHLLDEG